MADKIVTVLLNLVVDSQGVVRAAGEADQLAKSVQKAEVSGKKAGAGIAGGMIKAAAVMRVARFAYQAFIDGMKQTKEGEKALKTIESAFDNVKVALVEGAMPAVNQFVDFIVKNEPQITSIAGNIGKGFGAMVNVIANAFLMVRLAFAKWLQYVAGSAAFVLNIFGQKELSATMKAFSEEMRVESDKLMQDITDNAEAAKKILSEPIKPLTRIDKKDKKKDKKEEKKKEAEEEYGIIVEYAEKAADSEFEIMQEARKTRIDMMKNSYAKDLENIQFAFDQEHIKYLELLANNEISGDTYNEVMLAKYDEMLQKKSDLDTSFGEQYKAWNDDVNDYVMSKDIETFQKKMEITNQYLQDVQQIATQVQSFVSSITEAEVNQITEAAEKKKKEANATIKNKKKLDAELKKIDDEAAKREKEAREKEAVMAIIMATINTALGITKALTLQPPISFVMAALTAAAGAAQVALIASQSFAEGGVVEGSSTTGDRTMIRANSGEMIFNKGQQQRLLALADGTGTMTKGNITIGGDTIVIQGDVTEESIRAIQRTREDQMRDLRMLLTELNYAGQMV